jgi:zinc/manganese transport system permease protein
VVGILLVFTLVIGPAGIATRFCPNFWSGMIISVAIALLAVWSGILIACATSWPPSFWITTILFCLYVITEVVCRFIFKLE